MLQISKQFGKNLIFANPVPLAVYFIGYINEKHRKKLYKNRMLLYLENRGGGGRGGQAAAAPR